MLGNIHAYIKHVRSTHDDDGVDRLNYVYTIYLLLGFAVTLFAKNYVGEPLQCWVPAQWAGAWETFSESYCFVENTYFVGMNHTLPSNPQVRENMEMVYYQWVPFALSGMALFFYLPRAIWKVLSINSGLTLGEIMAKARKEAKSKRTEETGNIVMPLLRTEGEVSINHHSYLSHLYLVIKVVEVVNVVAQLLLINTWLGTEYTFWGLGILRDLLSGRQWQESGHFPRVAYCDLTVRELANVNNWTVQCVLMVNMFNEKIFIFLWFWYAFVAILSIFSLVKWTLNILSDNRQKVYVADLLGDKGPGDAALEQFYRKVLNKDGVLILRLVDENCGRLVASDVVQKMIDPTSPSPTSP